MFYNELLPCWVQLALFLGLWYNFCGPPPSHKPPIIPMANNCGGVHSANYQVWVDIWVLATWKDITPTGWDSFESRKYLVFYRTEHPQFKNVNISVLMIPQSLRTTHWLLYSLWYVYINRQISKWVHNTTWHSAYEDDMLLLLLWVMLRPDI